MNDLLERALRTLIQSLLASGVTLIGGIGLDVTGFVDVENAAVVIASFVIALLASLVSAVQGKVMPPKAKPAIR